MRLLRYCIPAIDEVVYLFMPCLSHKAPSCISCHSSLSIKEELYWQIIIFIWQVRNPFWSIAIHDREGINSILNDLVSLLNPNSSILVSNITYKVCNQICTWAKGQRQINLPIEFQWRPLHWDRKEAKLLLNAIHPAIWSLFWFPHPTVPPTGRWSPTISPTDPQSGSPPLCSTAFYVQASFKRVPVVGEGHRAY